MRRSEMKAVPDSAGLECHGKKYGCYCGYHEILKIAIHSQLMMQMKMDVGYPNYFIYLDGGP